ncbi:hypothetical protein P5P86_15785 [Nocardioides sp. BP30]|uniref:hypothetical protein n=1 Tax=Nocardioides sp. BP30 TaxID=3036374 RepID=UPI0024687DAA|nr:hypothetical protein [Nocardioides sp. BP30]WGL51414.1 hypothetical protein P5P86_15785 [Nocardioides sp. BP30]
MGLRRRQPYLAALMALMGMDGADHLILRVHAGECSSIVVRNRFDDAIAILDRAQFTHDVRKDVKSLNLPQATHESRWPPGEETLAGDRAQRGPCL